MLSILKCKKCHEKNFIQRSGRKKYKEKNHIKTMYCPWCKHVTQHIENYR